ncbi:MAG: hypothetical protein QOE73_402 [Verrucomicrobiota bacterium]
MRRSFVSCLATALLLSAAHWLPASIQDARESPTPVATPAVSQPKSKSSQKEQKHLSGSITNHGASSNAPGTPLNRYQKMVHDAVGSRWYNYVTPKPDLISIGTARVSFWIDRDGRVQNLKIIRNTSNEYFAKICTQSILEVKLPPIPKEVADSLPPKGLNEDISFTIFPDDPSKAATTPSPGQ